MIKKYFKEGFTVLWDNEKCSHCKNCITGLPEVFDLSKRPWINVNGATNEEIVDQINMCPTGALSIGENL